MSKTWPRRTTAGQAWSASTASNYRTAGRTSPSSACVNAGYGGKRPPRAGRTSGAIAGNCWVPALLSAAWAVRYPPGPSRPGGSPSQSRKRHIHRTTPRSVGPGRGVSYPVSHGMSRISSVGGQYGWPMTATTVLGLCTGRYHRPRPRRPARRTHRHRCRRGTRLYGQALRIGPRLGDWGGTGFGGAVVMRRGVGGSWSTVGRTRPG